MHIFCADSLASSHFISLLSYFIALDLEILFAFMFNSTTL